MSMKKNNFQMKKVLIAVITLCACFMSSTMAAYADFYGDFMNSIAGKGISDIMLGATKISVGIFVAGSVFILVKDGTKWLSAEDNEKPAAKQNIVDKFIVLIVVSCIPTVVPIIFKLFQFSADKIKF